MRAFWLAAAVLIFAAAAPAGRVAAQGGWRQIYDRPPTNVTTIEMFDGEFGLAIAAPGIVRTVDGGRTWLEPASKPLVAMGAIGIADAQHASRRAAFGRGRGLDGARAARRWVLPARGRLQPSPAGRAEWLAPVSATRVTSGARLAVH
jgi:hypothetical protein